MAIRNGSAKAALLTLLLGLLTFPNELPADNFHPGRVSEGGSGVPVSADVKAWAPNQRTNGGSCPEFGDAPVDAQISDESSGEFGLNVATDLASYHVVYCANGYHRRIDRHLPNSDDGSSVIPIPAQLLKVSEETSVQGNTVRLAIFALNELSYLHEVDPEGFQSSLDGYSEIVTKSDGNAGEVLSVLSGLIAQWASSDN